MRLTHGSDYGAPDRYLETVRVGSGGGPRVNFVCGFLGCDLRPFNPLIASLPRVLHVPQLATGWLAEFPRQVVAESRRERGGGATLLTRMAEVMFVEVLRRYMESTSAGRTGWLAALKDPIVGPALGQLHDRPAYAWSRRARPRGQHLAFGPLRTILRGDGDATDAVPCAVALAAGG